MGIIERQCSNRHCLPCEILLRKPAAMCPSPPSHQPQSSTRHFLVSNQCCPSAGLLFWVWIELTLEKWTFEELGESLGKPKKKKKGNLKIWFNRILFLWPCYFVNFVVLLWLQLSKFSWKNSSHGDKTMKSLYSKFDGLESLMNKRELETSNAKT